MAAGVDSILTRLRSEGAGQVIADLNRVAEAQKKLAEQAGKTDAALGAHVERMQKVGGTANALGNAFGAVAGGAGAAVGWALKLAGGLEQSRIAFTTLLGDAKKADAFIREMQQFAAQTPFEFAGLQNNATQMLAMGFTAKEVLPSLRVLGDAISLLGGGPEKLSQAIRALGQIKGAGMLRAEELNQLRDANIPVTEILSKKLGLTGQQIADIGNQGISAKVGIDALLSGMDELYGGGMEAQSKTLFGRLSNLTDAVNQLGGALGGEFLGSASEAVTKLTQLVEASKAGDGSFARDLATKLKWAMGVGAVGFAIGKVIKVMTDLSLITTARSLRNIAANVAEARTADALTAAYARAGVASATVGGKTYLRNAATGRFMSATQAAELAGGAGVGSRILGGLTTAGTAAGGMAVVASQISSFMKGASGKQVGWKEYAMAAGGGALAGGLMGGPWAAAIAGSVAALSVLVAKLLGDKYGQGPSTYKLADAMARKQWELEASSAGQAFSAAKLGESQAGMGLMQRVVDAMIAKRPVGFTGSGMTLSDRLWKKYVDPAGGVERKYSTNPVIMVQQMNQAIDGFREAFREGRDQLRAEGQWRWDAALQAAGGSDMTAKKQKAAELIDFYNRLNEYTGKYLEEVTALRRKMYAYGLDRLGEWMDRSNARMGAMESGRAADNRGPERAHRRRLVEYQSTLYALSGDLHNAWKALEDLNADEWATWVKETADKLEQRTSRADRALSYIEQGLLPESTREGWRKERWAGMGATYQFLQRTGPEGQKKAGQLLESAWNQEFADRMADDERHMGRLMEQYELSKKIDDLSGSERRKFLEASAALGVAAPTGAKAIKEQILEAAKKQYAFLVGIGSNKAPEFARQMQGFLLEGATKRAPNLAREIIATGGLSGLAEASIQQLIGGGSISTGRGPLPLRGAYRIGQSRLLAGSAAERIRATGAREGEKKARLDIYGHGDDEWGNQIVQRAIDGVMVNIGRVFNAPALGMQTVTP